MCKDRSGRCRESGPGAGSGRLRAGLGGAGAPCPALISPARVIDCNERARPAPRQPQPRVSGGSGRSPPGRTVSRTFNLLLPPPLLIEISLILDVL